MEHTPDFNNFEDIYQTYFHYVYLYALSLTKNEHLAEEIAQDTPEDTSGAALTSGRLVWTEDLSHIFFLPDTTVAPDNGCYLGTSEDLTFSELQRAFDQYL